MNSYVSVGYLQPGPSRITPGDLQVVSSGRKADCGRMPDWHYLSDVSLEWPLSIDLSGVKQDCDLPDDAEFGVVLSWRSDRTNLRGSIPVALVSDGENLLTAVISGATLGGTLTVEVVIVLRKAGTATSPLAPSREGTLLWSRTEQVVLEG
ncbi:MAG: hypothetical protein JWO62_2326, partial [Acidimicrobiaceae bacterium]|nr:hypothetical protein [Acidimicrobiaceae bacterium]